MCSVWPHVNKTRCGACISSSMWLLYMAELAILQSQHCYVYCWWHVRQTLGGGGRCRLKPTPSFGPKSFNSRIAAAVCGRRGPGGGAGGDGAAGAGAGPDRCRARRHAPPHPGAGPDPGCCTGQDFRSAIHDSSCCLPSWRPIAPLALECWRLCFMQRQHSLPEVGEMLQSPR